MASLNIKDQPNPFNKPTIAQKVIISINVTIISICLIVFLITVNSKIDPLRASNADKDNWLNNYYNCDHRRLKFEVTRYGEYWLIRNYYIGRVSSQSGCAQSVTYVTHGRDLNFFKQLPDLVRSWHAPISVSLFAPGEDFAATLSSIQYVRHCIPEANQVEKFVSFHIFFHGAHMPTNVPPTSMAAFNWPYNCSSSAPYKEFKRAQSYAHRHQLPYPVNVARNIARQAVNTHLILASDAVFMPGVNYISDRFIMKMLRQNCPIIDELRKIRTCKLRNENREVHVLPVYQLKRDAAIPTNALELADTLQHNNAELVSPKVPIFISDFRVAMHDERILWHDDAEEPQSLDQHYAMCLLGYKYVQFKDDLSPFLVYRSGSQSYGPNANNISNDDGSPSSTLLQEYSLLYGNEHEYECSECIKNGQLCY